MVLLSEILLTCSLSTSEAIGKDLETVCCIMERILMMVATRWLKF